MSEEQHRITELELNIKHQKDDIERLLSALRSTEKERDEAHARVAELEERVSVIPGVKPESPTSHSAANRAKYQAVFDHLHSLLLTQQCIGVSGMPELVGEFDRMLTRIEGWGT